MTAIKHLRFGMVALLAILVLAACQPVQAPATDAAPTADLPLDQRLTVDPSIRMGTLENGLTYYIRQNDEPANRAELRLVINAGSILEDEDQLGLAHFLEHMLFNGTERFPEQELVDFLEGLGMAFGPDVNAYTSYDETVYMLRIPMDDPSTLDTALSVLEDWAAYATLDAQAIDDERGIIVEEWRLRDQTASGRIREQLLPFLFGDSRYAERAPIGDMEVVRNAPRDAFVRFYQDWYRPDLMAIIAVGDFADVETLENRIIEQFSTLPSPADAPERTNYTVPDHEESRYKIITDPENPDTTLQIFYTQPAHEGQTVGEYRDILVSALFSNMLSFRLDEISRQADAPFIFAYAGQSDLVRPTELTMLGGQMKDGRVVDGLDVLLTEVERVRRYGFTESELQRAKNEIYRGYQEAYNDRNNRDSADIADEYIRNFLTDEPIPGIEVEFAIVEQYLPGISVDEVNAIVADYTGDANRKILLTAPETDTAMIPGEDELAAVVASIQDKAIEPYVDEEVTTVLMPTIPEPVAIVEESTIPELDVTRVVLENGVTVLLKPTDFRQEEVLLKAVNPGGSSLVDDEDFAEAQAIGSIIAQSGVADFSESELLKALSGKTVSISTGVRELSESIDGSAAPADLETLFQLVYLYVTEPRVDEEAFQVYQEQLRTAVENRSLRPESALQDALFRILYGDSVRRLPYLPLEEIEALDLERAFEIYQERFADMDEATFILVGNFEMEEAKRLAAIYLGNLPTLERSETWRDVNPDPPGGVIEENVYKGQEERSIVQMIFTGPTEATDANRLRVQALGTILDIRVREELREARGGVYASSVSGSVDELPDETYFVGVAFATDPQRVDELVDAVWQLVDEIQTEGPSQENLNKAKEIELRAYEENLESNSFWLGALQDLVLIPGEDPASITGYDELVNELTAEDVQSAAVDYLRDDNYIRVVLLPESSQ